MRRLFMPSTAKAGWAARGIPLILNEPLDDKGRPKDAVAVGQVGSLFARRG